MASKLWFLTNYSLKKKLKNKWFLIANIFLFILIVGVINIDSIISFFGGDFNQKQEIVVIDHDGSAYEVFEKNMENTNSLLGIEKETVIEESQLTEEEEKELLKNNHKILIVFDSSEQEYLTAKVISQKYIDTLDYQTLVQAITGTKQEIAMSKTNIDLEELNKITSPVSIERLILDEDKNTEEENMSMIMSTVFPTVILPFFMLVIFLVQMIGAEINEEKSSRSMEIIISNVSPKTHFFSKILSSNFFVIIQGLLLFLYGAIGLITRNMMSASNVTTQVTDSIGKIWQSLETSGFADKLVYVIPLTLILMILSFLAYSLIAGILASMTVNIEDYQQIQTPIILICLAGYYLSIMAGMFDGSVFIKALSFVPFISCLLAPALLIIGQISVFEVIIAIVILALFDYFVLKYGLKIYKIGILNYSTDKMWSRLLKAAKSKE